MEQELCPACKSDKIELLTRADGEWKKCLYQGCDGRISGDWFHFRPGTGLPPKVAKGKAAEPDADEEAEADGE